MTMLTAVNRWDYPGTGITGPYTVTRKILASSDLLVRTITTATGAVLATLVIGTDYSVANVGNDNGAAVTTTAAIPIGVTLQIIAIPPLTQPSDYKGQADFSPKRHEDSYDRLAAQILWLQDQLNRAVKAPLEDSTPLGFLPRKALRPGLYSAFDSVGDPIVSAGTGNDSALRTDLANTGAGTDGSRLSGFKRSETGAVALSVHAVLNMWLTPEMFGAVGDAVTDDTAAWQACIVASEGLSNKTILAQEKEYYIAGTLTAHQGTMIVGPGSQGSSEDKGFCFLHGGSGDCLVWDGNGVAFKGTGGGLKNCLIVKKTAVTGGNAIKVIATDDNHRPGEMMFDNVLIYALGTGQWSKAILVDGTACNTAGSRGVRTIFFNKVRVGGCSSNNQYIHLKQVTHVCGNVQMDTASGTGTLGMTIDDYWDHIDLDVRVGNIIVNYTGVDNPSLHLRGECNAFDNNSNLVIGLCGLEAVGGMNNASYLLRLSGPICDAFWAYKDASTANVTGDGTLYTVIPNVEDHDDNSSFDTTTGIYTAKCSGECHFSYGLVLTGLGAAHTTGEMFLDHRASGGTSKNSISFKYGVGPMRDAANQCSMSNSVQIRVAEGDTVKMQILVSGSTKTVGIGGAGATRYTFLAGKLLA